MKEVMFSPLSLGLFVCVHDISKGCGQIRMKFGEDPDPDPTTRLFKVILHHFEIGPKTIYSMTSQKS